MKKVKQLPDVRSTEVGTRVLWGKRVYEKFKNGRWGFALTPDLLKQVEQLYCEQGCNLREVAATLSLPDHPAISHSQIQKICNQQGWMRSHYGRVDSQIDFLTRNASALKKAHLRYGLTVGELAIALNIVSGVLGNFFVTELGIAPKDGHSNASRVREKYGNVLTPPQRDSWNRFLSLDVNDLSFSEYQSAVRKFSDLVALRYRLDKNHVRSMAYHVDHRVSKFYGYWTSASDRKYTFGNIEPTQIKRSQVLPLEVICHPVNLRIVDSHTNCVKNHKSELTVKKLKALVENHEIKIVPVNWQKEMKAILSKLKLVPLEHD